MKRTEKVLLIYTGGTIGMGCNPATGALEPLDFDHLADNVPELLGITKFDDLEGALRRIDFDKEYKTYIYQYASEI